MAKQTTNINRFYKPQEVFKKRPLVYSTLSEDTKEMLQFFPPSTHELTVAVTFGKANLQDFIVYKENFYTVLVPKKPSSDFLPMLCAHTDTVGNVHPSTFAYTDVTESYICNAEHKNLGADDRLGCYLISKMIQSNPNDFMFALFDQEETGGIGSSAFTRSPEFSEICKKVSCFLGLDRKGDSDMASYGSESQEFLEELRKIPDFSEAFGTFTDVATLAEESNISCVNFSVGYYGEHTVSEKFSPTETLKTLEMLRNNLPKSLWEKQYTFEPVTKSYYGVADYGYYRDFLRTHEDFGNYVECECCGSLQPSSSIIETYEGYQVCDYCLGEYYGKEATPQHPKTNNKYPVDRYNFVCFIGWIVDDAICEEVDNKEILKDINLLSYFSKFEALKEDQAQKVRDLCEKYRYCPFI